jgi:hypothetical protein
MATAAPAISEARLSPGGGLFAPPQSKKPMYTVRDVSDVSVGRPQLRIAYREASPAKQPKHVLFAASYNPRLRIIRPIPVELSRRQGQFYARFTAADEFGVGPSMSMSLEDLGKTLAELFIGLSEKRDHLGRDLLALHAKLSRYIAFREK